MRLDVFELSMSEFPAAWMAMFDLLEENGCKCGYGHHYEIYQNNHDEHPEKKVYCGYLYTC